MHENLSQEELEYVLEAGLEKVAYEEGVNEYVDSLEKVASVHNIDAEELHDFLEKAAAEDEEEEPTRRQKLMQAIKGNPGKAGALVGAGLGAGAGALNAGKLQELISKGNLSANLADSKKLKGLSAGAGALGGAALGAGAAKAGEKAKQKTAAAYGLDEETFDYLIENGIEALNN